MVCLCNSSTISRTRFLLSWDEFLYETVHGAIVEKTVHTLTFFKVINNKTLVVYFYQEVMSGTSVLAEST